MKIELPQAFISAAQAAEVELLHRPHWQKLRESITALPTAETLVSRGASSRFVVSGPAVEIGASNDLRPEELSVLSSAVSQLIPWRKGPFVLFDQCIDAEWRSDLKWERIEPLLGTLAGQVVADVGCGNGYYLFRATALKPAFAIGIDPSEQFYYTFSLLNRLAGCSNIAYAPVGWQALAHTPEFFDCIICMGVLYHQRDPFELLSSLRVALKPGGRLLLETQIMPGEDSMALFPPDRYAKARNVFSLPTASCVETWLARSGFTGTIRGPVTPVTEDEQRQTELAPYESLSDFLDPKDHTRTIEGYPAPWRGVFLSFKQ